MTVLRIGSKGFAVSELQRALRITADGWYGAQTAKAVAEYQRRAGLVVDGVAGPKTQAMLRDGSVERLLRESDLVAAAEKLGVQLAKIKAVNQVESNGSGFLDYGRPRILFERHILYRRLLAAGVDADAIAARAPNVCNRARGGYVGGASEWSRITTALQVVPEQHAGIVYESTSWGLFQIMGFHWEALGYASVFEFVAAMRQSEGSQLDAFVRFILADPTLLKALRAGAWATFAKQYNGPAYKENMYDVKLQRAYARFAAEQGVPA